MSETTEEMGVSGGADRFWETPKNALVREIREEFGIGIEIISLLEVGDYLNPEERQH